MSANPLLAREANTGARVRGRARALLAAAVISSLGCSNPPPAPKDETALLARLAALEGRLEESEKAERNLLLRLAALEAASGKKRADDDLAGRVGALETKVGALDDRVGVLEGARGGARPTEEKPPSATIVDRKKEPSAPAPGEVVKPLAAIDGETFSFVREGSVDLARLAGIEVPVREPDAERKKRAQDAWGAVDFDAVAKRARERLEELLSSRELSFEYAPADGKRGHLVYAHVKTEAGELVLNEVLLREGLALARGEHPRKSDFEKLEAEAREAKRGLFAR